MRKSLFLLFGLLPFCSLTSAQNKILLYFNKDWEVTTKEKAVYLREAEYDLQNFKLNGKVTDRDLKGNPVMEGYYLNGKKNGEFVFYFGNGKIESKGSYLNNKRVGKWIYNYSNDQIKQTINYSDDPENADFYVIDYYDRNGDKTIMNGTGKWVNDSIEINEKNKQSFLRINGKFKNGLKKGEWKMIRISDHKLLMTERFRKGRLKEIQIGMPVKPIRSSSKGNLTDLGQKLKAERSTGTLDKNMISDVPVQVKSGDVNWRNLQLENNITPNTAMPLEYAEKYYSDKWNNNVKNYEKYLNEKKNPTVGSFDLLESEVKLKKIKTSGENIELNPDRKITKLNKTEMLLIDPEVFPQSLFYADLETFFKTISPSKILINDRTAMYPKGEDVFLAFISKNIEDSLANQNGLTVFVRVEIDPEGSPTNIDLLKGINDNLDKEALRVIGLIKKWLPAIKNGETVSSSLIVPVKFKK